MWTGRVVLPDLCQFGPVLLCTQCYDQGDTIKKLEQTVFGKLKGLGVKRVDFIPWCGGMECPN